MDSEKFWCVAFELEQRFCQTCCYISFSFYSISFLFFNLLHFPFLSRECEADLWVGWNLPNALPPYI